MNKALTDKEKAEALKKVQAKRNAKPKLSLEEYNKKVGRTGLALDIEKVYKGKGKIKKRPDPNKVVSEEYAENKKDTAKAYGEGTFSAFKHGLANKYSKEENKIKPTPKKIN